MRKITWILNNHPITEFEVQAYLIRELRALGFVVRGEIKLGRHGKVDLLLSVDGKKATRIIEIKRSLSRVIKREQIERYARYAPVDLVRGMEAARRYVDRWRGRWNESRGEEVPEPDYWWAEDRLQSAAGHLQLGEAPTDLGLSRQGRSAFRNRRGSKLRQRLRMHEAIAAR